MELHNVQAALRAFDQGDVALIAADAVGQLRLGQPGLLPSITDDIDHDLVRAGEDGLRHRGPAVAKGAEQLDAGFEYDDFPCYPSIGPG